MSCCHWPKSDVEQCPVFQIVVERWEYITPLRHLLLDMFPNNASKLCKPGMSFLRPSEKRKNAKWEPRISAFCTSQISFQVHCMHFWFKKHFQNAQQFLFLVRAPPTTLNINFLPLKCKEENFFSFLPTKWRFFFQHRAVSGNGVILLKRTLFPTSSSKIINLRSK